MLTKLVYDNFESYLNSNDMPTIIDIWAHGCPPCDAIEPILTEMVEKYNGSELRIARINVDENEPIAMKFKLRAVPTILLYNKGQLLKQLAVPKPEELRFEIIKLVDQ